jgi:hypothetical protein
MNLEREIKRYEGRLEIAEKERVLCKQQLELLQNSNLGGGGGASISQSYVG